MSRSAHSARRHSREVALQVLYALDLERRGGDPKTAASPEETFARVASHFEMPEGAKAFALEIVLGTDAAGGDLDALISEHARNWKLSRMAAVDRNVLRLGTYELLHTDTPAAVVLDEAVELARRFGSDSSPGFVNGLLDAIARHVRAGGGDAAGAANT